MASILKRAYASSLFDRDPLTPLRKLPLTKIRYLGNERDLFDLETVRQTLTNTSTHKQQHKYKQKTRKNHKVNK